MIYLSTSDLLNEINVRSATADDNFTKKWKSLSEKIISLSKKKDTAEMNNIDVFVSIVGSEIKKGHAKVYYKKENSFVPTVTYRAEKYDRFVYRFFYLPGGQPFFSAMIFDFIPANEKNREEQLAKLNEKLKEIDRE